MGAIRSGSQIFSAYREVIFFVKFVEFVAFFLLITGHEFHELARIKTLHSLRES